MMVNCLIHTQNVLYCKRNIMEIHHEYIFISIAQKQYICQQSCIVSFLQYFIQKKEPGVTIVFQI